MKHYLPLRQFFVLAACLLLGLTSCKKDLNLVEQQTQQLNGETLIPVNANLTVHELKLKNHKTLHLNEVNGTYFLGGDIELTNEQAARIMADTLNSKSPTKKPSSTFITDFSKRWPNKTIYYVLQNPINQQTILNAIAEWESFTDIRFVQRTNQPNYVMFNCCPTTAGAAGESQLGMVGGGQSIRLQDNASLSTVIHEIGHTVGLMHEQMRADRDLYIDVNISNIKPEWRSQYDTYTTRGELGSESGTYDFDSVMGYNSYYPQVGYEGNTTYQLARKNGGDIFQGSHLSAGDIEGVRLLYEPVYVTYESTETVYEFDGFVDKRDQEMSIRFWKDAARTIPGVNRSISFLITKMKYSQDTYQALPNLVYVEQTPGLVPLGGGLYPIYLGMQETRLTYNQQMDLEVGSYWESLGIQLR